MVLTVAAFVAGAGPAAAKAPSCVAPQGTAGLEQYCESIPTGGGNAGPGERTPGTPQRALSADSVQRLQGSAQGRRLIAALAAQGVKPASPARGHTGGKKSAAPRAPRTAAPAAPAVAGAPLAGVASSVGDGASTGPGFLWLLLSIAVVVGGLGWVRSRRSS